MRRSARIVVYGLGACCCLLASSVCAAQWERVDPGGAETAFVCLAIDPQQPLHLVAASSGTLHVSSDGGQHWQTLSRLPGQVEIQRVAISASTLLAATNRGVYGSWDGGAKWARVFRGSDDRERTVTRVAFHPIQADTALLGTRGGLFLSRDAGRRWERVPVPLAARDVVDVAVSPQSPDQIYLVAAEGVFVGDLASGTWQHAKRLGAEESAVEEPAAADADVETDEETGVLHHLSAIAVDPQKPSTLYLGSSRGLELSADAGASWQIATPPVTGPPAIARVLVVRHSPPVLYTSTAQDILRYDPGPARWTVLTQGLGAVRVHDLAATDAHLWAATDGGLYRDALVPEEPGEPAPPTAQELLGNFVHEPTIGQVREAAIRYADVHPEKIRQWRMDAAWRALLPTVDVGLDHNQTQNVHFDEGTFPKFQLVETKDRKAGLDLSVKWDLGDLIWNENQTAIDVRSKLMVQLRNDIVDEVTRAYFERRRIQVAVLMDPQADQRTVAEKELRIQELTAQLDGLTGGNFSDRMKVGGH